MYIMWDFSESVDWHLCSCIHTYMHMYQHDCSTFVYTVLLSRTVYRYIHTHVYAYVLVYVCKDLYCTYVHDPQCKDLCMYILGMGDIGI